jgi:fibronectin-binding autotransporter adhesin
MELERKYRWFKGLLSLQACLALAGSATLSAADRTWDGTSGTWETATNWDPDLEPTNVDRAIINNGGTATVTQGDSVTSQILLGSASGQSGTIKVITGGTLFAQGGIIVGDAGTGSIELIDTDGIYSGTGTVIIGNAATGVGSITLSGKINGVGTDWSTQTLAATVKVGVLGDGTLGLSGGSTFNGYAALVVAEGATSDSSVSVDGTGSIGRFNTVALAGATGAVAALNVTDGGSFQNLGLMSIGVGGTATVTLSGNSTLTSNGVSFGTAVGGVGIANVSGTDTVWTTSTANIGVFGTGTLNVSGGARVSGGNVNLGTNLGAEGKVSVTGTGTEWLNTATMTIGAVGRGEVEVLSNAVGSSSGLYLGVTASGLTTSGYGMMTLDGADTAWTNNGTLSLGTQSNLLNSTNGEGHLIIRNGASMTNNTLNMGSVAGKTSDILVTGEGSYLSAGATLMGNSATSTTRVDVKAGADVDTGAVTLGTFGAGSSSTIVMEDAGTTWDATGEVIVGRYGAGVMEVKNGAKFTGGTLILAQRNTGTGFLLVDGAGSEVVINGAENLFGLNVHLGIGGKADLVISNGGLFHSGGMAVSYGYALYLGDATVPFEEGVGQGDIVVTGAGSKLDVDGAIELGVFEKATLTVEDGGVVEAEDIEIAANDVPEVEAHVYLSGSTSRIDVSGTLSVGYNTLGTLDASGGAQITSGIGIVGRLGSAVGTANLTGDGTKWTITNDLILSDVSGTGELNVENGADVQVGDELIVTWSGDGSEVNIRDTGSTMTAGRLYAGGYFTAGDSGVVTVADGGSLTVSGAARLFTQGRLYIGEGAGAGSFSAASLRNDGAVEFNHTGEATFNTPTSGVGNLVKKGAGRVSVGGNNTFSGGVSIEGGTLRATHSNALGSTAGGTTVASGAALELDGGVSIGAEALQISGSGVEGGGALRSVSGSNTFAGTITLAINSVVTVVGDSLGLSGDVVLNGNGLVMDAQGNLVMQGDLAGNGAVTKTGGGKVTVTASTTYTGDFTVSAGELALNGSFAAGSQVFVENGATLSGTGTAADIFLADGGHLAPGQSPGTLHADNFFWAGGGILEYELGDASSQANSDLLVLSEDLDSGRTEGPWAFVFTDGIGLPTLGATYTLITFTEQRGFKLEDFVWSYNGALGGFDGDFLLEANALKFVLVPEPGTGVLLTLGALAGLGRRRRHPDKERGRPGPALK